MADKNVGLDFASILNNAKKSPEDEGGGMDLPDGFPFKLPKREKFVDSTNNPEFIPGVKQYDFKVFVKVFTIYRPWEKCDRCQNAIAGQVVQLPTDAGDYDCPHTNREEYQAITDKCLSGRFLSGPETEIARQDGVVLKSLKWFEPILTPGKK